MKDPGLIKEQHCLRAIVDDMYKETVWYHKIMLLSITFGIWFPLVLSFFTPSLTANIILITIPYVMFLLLFWFRNRVMIVLYTSYWCQDIFKEEIWKAKFQFSENDHISIDELITHNLLMVVICIYIWYIVI